MKNELTPDERPRRGAYLRLVGMVVTAGLTEDVAVADLQLIAASIGRAAEVLERAVPTNVVAPTTIHMVGGK